MNATKKAMQAEARKVKKAGHDERAKVRKAARKERMANKPKGRGIV